MSPIPAWSAPAPCGENLVPTRQHLVTLTTLLLTPSRNVESLAVLKPNVTTMLLFVTDISAPHEHTGPGIYSGLATWKG